MSAAPITPELWERMPWHAKSRIITQLDKRILQLQEQIADLQEAPRYRGQPVDFPTNPADRELWTNDQLLRAHAAFAQGSRIPTVVTGEREWQRRRSLAKRRKQQSARLAVVRLMTDAGASREEIAAELETSTRHVSRLLNDLELQERQAS